MGTRSARSDDERRKPLRGHGRRRGIEDRRFSASNYRRGPRPCRRHTAGASRSRGPDSMSRLFGTDGVRGKAGTYPLDPPTVRRLGAALARALALDSARAKGDGRPRFLSGRDTRESGAWIERELAFGIN